MPLTPESPPGGRGDLEPAVRRRLDVPAAAVPQPVVGGAHARKIPEIRWPAELGLDDVVQLHPGVRGVAARVDASAVADECGASLLRCGEPDGGAVVEWDPERVDDDRMQHRVAQQLAHGSVGERDAVRRGGIDELRGRCGRIAGVDHERHVRHRRSRSRPGAHPSADEFTQRFGQQLRPTRNLV